VQAPALGIADDWGPVIVCLVNASITNIGAQQIALEMSLEGQQANGKRFAAKAGDHLAAPFNLPEIPPGFPQFISSPLSLAPNETSDGTIPFVLFPPDGRKSFFEQISEGQIAWQMTVRDRIGGAKRVLSADSFISYRP
jgi:hypothetical protein